MVDAVKVYVKSERIPIGVTEVHEKTPAGMGVPATVDTVKKVVQYDYVVPDDQKSALVMIKDICEERGYKVEIIDVTKEGLLKRLSEVGISDADSFPVVVTPYGRKVYGKNLNHAVLQEVLPADLNGKEIRAFVYLRIKKGNERKLLDKLLFIPEVREVHLIPGEWDALVVLGLPPNQGSYERQALDFVMQNIRSIEWIEATSTIVPVYSYTKFTVLTEARRNTFASIERI
ncbi:hypothetical protein B9Q02_01575 [Candidatus Marsarchaeota G1 archaeon BE_D]|jgi:hypothetical protein|uniref:Transcription regulator AsnC/Lrp ligand binding domain-containing protein n=1 Tax=Candidatus Marsarchaeota G1 archaeon BE_D TaxID=1978156 RepID=A0A2R6AJY9_9ARCH|nr:MAG: hypothetical protein B9Q02_01575 [Candidatus Marsarchaeota G1 archaeon BE_D]